MARLLHHTGAMTGQWAVRGRTVGALALVVAIGISGGVIAPAPAAAETNYTVSAWNPDQTLENLSVPVNTYTIVEGIPAWLTSPITFTIQVSGEQPVCKMEFDDTVVTAPPFQFTLTPEMLTSFGLEHQHVNPLTVHRCGDGRQIGTVSFQTSVPYGVSTRYVYATGSTMAVTVKNNTTTPATVTLSSDGGPLSVQHLPAKASPGQLSSIKVAISTKSYKKTTPLQLTVAGTDGPTMTFPMLVTHGWATYGESTITYRPCQTVRWHYDPADLPAGTSNASMLRDVRGALSRLSTYAALTFVEVDSADQADLKYQWEAMKERNVGAAGGGAFGEGWVTINSRASWSSDRYAGFGRTRASHSGRGWMLVHETMHVLGFTHPNTRNSIMYGLNTGQMRFIASDIEGLRMLYPASCTRW